MRRPVPLLFFALALCLPRPAPAALTPGDFPPAVTAAVADGYLRSVDYYLARYGGSGPALRGADRDPLLREALAKAGPNPPLDALLAALRQALLARPGAAPAGLAGLEGALKETAAYFDLSSDRMLQAAALPDAVPASTAAPAGFAPAIADLPAARLPMHDIDAYLAGQAGPMSGVLDWLGPGLRRIVFSRLPLAAALPLAGERPAALYRLRLPGATYAFEAYLADGDKQALILCAFAGDAWFEHTQRVYRLLLARKGLAPEIAADPRPAPAAPCPGVLEAFAAGMPRSFHGLLLGYYQELRAAFRPYIVKELDAGAFKAFAAELGGRTYVAVEARDSWYGDILGATIGSLLGSGVRFKELYFAGSAGSLAYHTPYALAHPDCYYTGRGERIKFDNIAAGSGGGCHETVASPLAETADYLAALPADAFTIDVEGLGLLLAVQRHNASSPDKVALGVSYLITDYPRGLKAADRFSLSGQRLKAKLAGTSHYARALLARLRDGKKDYLHQAEADLNRSAVELSAANMAALRAGLGALAPEEEALRAALVSTPPPFIMRMGRRRFARMLEAGLALAPAELAALEGVAVSTQGITPPAEAELYGAYDYLFAGIGQNDRAEKYGAYQIFIASAAWARRSYATPQAGYRLIEEAGAPGIEKAREGWGRQIIAPGDYADYLALAYISASRAGKLSAPGQTRGWALLKGCDACYLEGKVLKYFTPEEIDCLEVPPGGKDGLPLTPALLKKTFDKPGACLAAGSR